MPLTPIPLNWPALKESLNGSEWNIEETESSLRIADNLYSERNLSWCSGER